MAHGCPFHIYSKLESHNITHHKIEILMFFLIFGFSSPYSSWFSVTLIFLSFHGCLFIAERRRFFRFLFVEVISYCSYLRDMKDVTILKSVVGMIKFNLGLLHIKNLWANLFDYRFITKNINSVVNSFVSRLA